jgi:hypothetical protein
MKTIKQVYDGFNELVQVFFGFALGLAFSQANISVGWIFFWIVVWEIGVFCIMGKTSYYDPFFRLAYNCIFLLAIIFGQYIYYGKTTFQEFLYSESINTKKSFSGEKYKVMESFENYLENFLVEEENTSKRKKLVKKYKLFYSL